MRVLAVVGPKGGVGKTTVAVNLATAFARRGLAVGLLDMDPEGASITTMLFHGSPPRLPAGAPLDPVEVHGVRVFSGAFFHDDADRPDAGRLADIRWGAVDLVIADLPAISGKAVSALRGTGPVSAILVSTPQDVAVQETVHAAGELRAEGIGILGLIENLSFHVCASCGHRDNILGHGGAANAAGKLGLPFLGAVPIESEVRKCSDSGMPIVLKAKESPGRDALLHVADMLADRLGLAPVAPTMAPH